MPLRACQYFSSMYCRKPSHSSLFDGLDLFEWCIWKLWADSEWRVAACLCSMSLFHYAAEERLVTWYHFLLCSSPDPQRGFSEGGGAPKDSCWHSPTWHDYDFLWKGKPSIDIYVNEGNIDFCQGADVSSAFTCDGLCVSGIIRLGRRIGYISNSHLIWLMHSDLFRWENTLGEWADICSHSRLCH